MQARLIKVLENTERQIDRKYNWPKSLKERQTERESERESVCERD